MSKTTQANETSGSLSELERLLSFTITQHQVSEVFAMDKEATVCALLNLYVRCMSANNAKAQGQLSPSTPSSTTPPYLEAKKEAQSKAEVPANHKDEHRNVSEPDKTITL